MADTAQSLIKDSLQEILVQASEQPIEADEFQSSIRALNRMMAENPYNKLGFVDVVDPSDVITIDPGAMNGVLLNLGLRLAPSYDIQPSPDLRTNARDALRTLRKLTANNKPTQMPSTMPIGSGNEDWFTGRIDEHFFNPVLIPAGAETLSVGEIDSFSVDFSHYLLEGATITGFTVASNDKLTILSSAESDGFITFSAQGVQIGYGKVCVDVDTSNDRAKPEQVDFEITKGCSI